MSTPTFRAGAPRGTSGAPWIPWMDRQASTMSEAQLTFKALAPGPKFSGDGDGQGEPGSKAQEKREGLRCFSVWYTVTKNSGKSITI